MSYKNKIIASGIDSESATDGHVLTADGLGGVAFEAAAGGGSTKATFLFNGAFYSSSAPAPTFYLPITTESEQSNPQRYNTIAMPVTSQLKKVVLIFSGGGVNDGDITVTLRERDTNGSTIVSIESQTVNYTADISEGNYDQIYEFTFTSSAVVGPGHGVWLQISATFATRAWQNLIWSAYFEEV